MLKCHLKGKTCRKLANGQDIDYSEEKMVPGLHLPLYWDCFLQYSNMFIGIYSRHQVSVYRTIGPQVLIFDPNVDCGYSLEPPH